MTDDEMGISSLLKDLPGADHRSLSDFIRMSEARRRSGEDLEEELLASIAMKWRGATRAAS